ncbi:hypothetical protein [Paenibacillus glucanolyticus]|uniref:hypothetical protein n=1 Tax=Paenibacillus glucanolyticus TaxID=59843 RepID=UPI0034CF48BA
MVDELILYFSKSLNSKALVFKYMKWVERFFWISLLIVIAGGVYTILFNKGSFLAIGIVIFIFAAYILNRKAKQIIKEKYGIVVQTKLWSADNRYHRYIQNQIEDYLSDRHLDTEKKLGKLTEQLNKRAERAKPTIFFLPGFFIVLFIPVWSQFQIVLFKGISLNDAMYLLVIHFIILALLTYLLAVFKYITYDLVTLRRQSILHLIDYIEDIILNKMDEKKMDEKKEEINLRFVRRRKK